HRGIRSGSEVSAMPTGWDRRGVLITGGAVAVLAAAPATAVASFAVCHIVIADGRFCASRAFAGRAGKFGGGLVWAGGGITDFWRDELDLLWRHEKVSLSGLTAQPAFFYLERLAMDRGLRVVFRQEIRQTESRLLIAWQIAQKPMRAGAAA